MRSSPLGTASVAELLRQPATLYQQVYDAERPELFFKSAAWRVAGPDQPIAVRSLSL